MVMFPLQQLEKNYAVYFFNMDLSAQAAYEMPSAGIRKLFSLLRGAYVARPNFIIKLCITSFIVVEDIEAVEVNTCH